MTSSTDSVVREVKVFVVEEVKDRESLFRFQLDPHLRRRRVRHLWPIFTTEIIHLNLERFTTLFLEFNDWMTSGGAGEGLEFNNFRREGIFRAEGGNEERHDIFQMLHDRYYKTRMIPILLLIKITPKFEKFTPK